MRTAVGSLTEGDKGKAQQSSKRFNSTSPNNSQRLAKFIAFQERSETSQQSQKLCMTLLPGTAVVFSQAQGGQTSGASRSVSLLLREQLFSHAVNLFHSMIELLNAHTKRASPQKRNHGADAAECRKVVDEQHPSLRHSLKVCESNFDVEENTEQSNEDDVWSDFWKLPFSDPVENNRPSHNRQHSKDSAQKKCLTGRFIPQRPAVAGCSPCTATLEPKCFSCFSQELHCFDFRWTYETKILLSSEAASKPGGITTM